MRYAQEHESWTVWLVAIFLSLILHFFIFIPAFIGFFDIGALIDLASQARELAFNLIYHGG